MEYFYASRSKPFLAGLNRKDIECVEINGFPFKIRLHFRKPCRFFHKFIIYNVPSFISLCHKKLFNLENTKTYLLNHFSRMRVIIYLLNYSSTLENGDANCGNYLDKLLSTLSAKQWEKCLQRPDKWATNITL